jgi:hypothetical protein
MRRGIGFALISIGLFVAVLGGAIRYWASDRLVVVPLNLYSTVDLTGRATYLDMSTLKEKSGDVVLKQTIRGDVGASDDRVLVTDLSQVISDADGKLIRAGVERAAIDRHTGAAVNCCGETVDGKPIKHEGYLFKLPFDTPQHDLLLWDGTAGEAYPAAYRGVDKIAGHRVYKFVLTVPAHQIQTQADSGTLVGEASGYDVPVWNQSTKTLWVEPVTGTPLAAQVRTETTLRDSHNRDEATVFSGTLRTKQTGLTPVDENIKRIRVVKNVPPLLAALGAVLASTGVGLLLWRRRRAAHRAARRAARRAPVSPAIPARGELPPRRPEGGGRHAADYHAPPRSPRH